MQGSGRANARILADAAGKLLTQPTRVATQVEYGEYLRAFRRLAIVDAERETGGQLPAEAEASGMDAVGMAQRFDVRQ